MSHSKLQEQHSHRTCSSFQQHRHQAGRRASRPRLVCEQLEVRRLLAADLSDYPTVEPDAATPTVAADISIANQTAPSSDGNEIIRFNSAVVTRRLFYGGSTFANGPGGVVDAIDTTKQALRPGETATLANISNYVLGLNGLIVDLSETKGTVSNQDFVFETSNGLDPFVQFAGNATVSEIPSGTTGVTRIRIDFENSAIRNTWLRVTILANATTTGLTSPDIFYFGNAVGETGGSSVPGTPEGLRTNAMDTGFVRVNLSPNAVPVDNRFDVNKDGFVNDTDVAALRSNQLVLGTIYLFTPPVPTAGPVAENEIEPDTEIANEHAPLAWLTNPVNPLDVDNDGSVSPLDALIVINFLRRHASGELGSASQAVIGSSPPFVDSNRDGSVSPIDVLQIINALNRIANTSAEGVSNQFDSTVAVMAEDIEERRRRQR